MSEHGHGHESHGGGHEKHEGFFSQLKEKLLPITGGLILGAAVFPALTGVSLSQFLGGVFAKAPTAELLAKLGSMPLAEKMALGGGILLGSQVLGKKESHGGGHGDAHGGHGGGHGH